MSKSSRWEKPRGKFAVKFQSCSYVVTSLMFELGQSAKSTSSFWWIDRAVSERTALTEVPLIGCKWKAFSWTWWRISTLERTRLVWRWSHSQTSTDVLLHSYQTATNIDHIYFSKGGSGVRSDVIQWVQRSGYDVCFAKPLLRLPRRRWGYTFSITDKL